MSNFEMSCHFVHALIEMFIQKPSVFGRTLNHSSFPTSLDGKAKHHGTILSGWNKKGIKTTERLRRSFFSFFNMEYGNRFHARLAIIAFAACSACSACSNWNHRHLDLDWTRTSLHHRHLEVDWTRTSHHHHRRHHHRQSEETS